MQRRSFPLSSRSALSAACSSSLGTTTPGWGMTDRPQKITFAKMRDMGVRGLLIYCADYRCSHSIPISGDAWPDDARLSEITGTQTRSSVCALLKRHTGGVMRSVRAVLFGVGIAAFSTHTIAQTPPTATKEFNLRIKCKQMADEKAESMQERLLTNAKGASVGLKPADVAAMNEQIEQRRANVILSSHASNYDPKTNRCYIEIIKQWKYGQHSEFEKYIRQVYDAQTDKLLAYAYINQGQMVGIVYDPEHARTADNNLGFDDTNAYMDEKMRTQR